MGDLNAILPRLEVLEKRDKEHEKALSLLQSEYAKLEAERDAYHKLYLEALERCRKLELGLIGNRTERTPDDKQLSPSVIEMMLGERQKAEIEALEQKPVQAHTRRKPIGRHSIPEHVPRVELEIVPEDVKRAGLDAFERIGEDVKEVLERRPASVVIVRVIKPKFKRKESLDGKTEILTGSTPKLPIERGIAGPGFWRIRWSNDGRTISRFIASKRSMGVMGS